MRGTTRSPERVAAIEEAGIEAVVADPDRLGTLMPQLDGVSAVCWLMGSASGPPDDVAALHGPRLRSLLERLVDTPVRGFVYEAHPGFPEGEAIAREAQRTWRMPVEVIGPQGDEPAWLAAARQAAGRVLSPDS